MEKLRKALVYHGPGNKAVEDRLKLELQAPGDPIARMTKTTICGTPQGRGAGLRAGALDRTDALRFVAQIETQGLHEQAPGIALGAQNNACHRPDEKTSGDFGSWN
jgi:hypothetical protein